ncbi:MAG: holo-ACP synthase [Proteobacteria bacterium]|nr:holo-ACP synthase [Pseudomonadota bacterium]
MLLKLLNLAVTPRVAVGSDIVWVPDIRASVEQFGERYLKFIFTEKEIANCTRNKEEISCWGLAARFAAKEATMKMLRPNRDQLLPWRSIEVVQSPNGAVNIKLHAPASRMAGAAGIDQITLSMSHERDYATAVVVGMGRATYHQ